MVDFSFKGVFNVLQQATGGADREPSLGDAESLMEPAVHKPVAKPAQELEPVRMTC